jgi:hypothetical protein
MSKARVIAEKEKISILGSGWVKHAKKCKKRVFIFTVQCFNDMIRSTVGNLKICINKKEYRRKNPNPDTEAGNTTFCNLSYSHLHLPHYLYLSSYLPLTHYLLFTSLIINGFDYQFSLTTPKWKHVSYKNKVLMI